MSERTKNRDSDLLPLCQEAKDLGASQAVVIPATEIVVDERTSLKCQVPLCRHYGIDLMCPPNVMPVSQFRDILKYYDSAILIKVDIPSNDPPGNNEGKPGAEYMNVVREAKNKLREIVSRIEALCFNQGYYFAAGLVGGSCTLCDECVGTQSGLPCRYPFKARPAMEAMGIDVVNTARKAGLDLSFTDNESKGWVGLVLVT